MSFRPTSLDTYVNLGLFFGTTLKKLESSLLFVRFLSSEILERIEQTFKGPPFRNYYTLFIWVTIKHVLRSRINSQSLHNFRYIARMQTTGTEKEQQY